MVEQYLSLITADGTIGYTLLYAAMAFVFVVFGIILLYLFMANYRHRANSATWYKDQVYAFKVGFIEKRAKEEGIEMKYPPKTDLAKALEDEVSDDLRTP